jgi:hypothetical protein
MFKVGPEASIVQWDGRPARQRDAGGRDARRHWTRQLGKIDFEHALGQGCFRWLMGQGRV